MVATLPWLQQVRVSPLSEAGWLNAYAALGRRWPLIGLKLPAPTPVGCLERAFELARQYGGTGTAFSAAWFLANIAISENDRALAQRRLQELREVTNPEHGAQAVNLLLVEAAVLALAQDWRRARSTIDHADALAVQRKFPPSERWSVEMARQRIEIASGNGETASMALRELAAGTPEGMRREFALILADVADASTEMRSAGAPTPERVRSIMQAASAQAWPGFATLLAPIAARICAAAIEQGIEPGFARQVIAERRLSAPSPFETHWPWPIRVHALGGLRVEVDGEELRFGARGQRKPLDLLKLIVVHGPAPIDAALVLDALWPDAEGGAARAAFDMAVMRLRKLLGREEALRLDAGRVGLDPGCVWVDAWAWAAGASDAYPGPLFGPDAVEPWWAECARAPAPAVPAARPAARTGAGAVGRPRRRTGDLRIRARPGSARRGALPGGHPLSRQVRPAGGRPAGVPPLPRAAVDRAGRRAVARHRRAGRGRRAFRFPLGRR